MKTSEPLTESLEDYLETIYRIILDKTAVRVKDISAAMGVKNPSVTSALKALEKRSLINYEPYGIISLTRSGLEVALKITEKHRLLKNFFRNVLGIDSAAADDTACRMEHVIPREVYVRFVQFVKYLYISQGSNDGWIANFNAFAAHDQSDISCPDCLEDYFSGTGFDFKEASDGIGNA